MIRHLAMFVAVLFSTVALASDAEEPNLEYLKWVARPIVIFADSEADPRLAQQLGWLERDRAELEERDVVILVDTDVSGQSALRQRLRPRDFTFILIDKDGEIKYRKPSPVKAGEIIRLIDRFPSRQLELETERGVGTGG